MGGYMIGNAAGATMTLENNCFIGHQVVGWGLVHHVGNAAVSSSNNFVARLGDNSSNNILSVFGVRVQPHVSQAIRLS